MYVALWQLFVFFYCLCLLTKKNDFQTIYIRVDSIPLDTNYNLTKLTQETHRMKYNDVT